MINQILISLLIGIACHAAPARNILNTYTACQVFAFADTTVNPISYKHARNVARGTYSGAHSGDCLHVVFSCGDFGLSERDLPEKDEQLWSSLYADGPAGIEPNSDMVGKTFEITYVKTSVKACDGSEDLHQVDAPKLIGFKLLK